MTSLDCLTKGAVFAILGVFGKLVFDYSIGMMLSFSTPVEILVTWYAVCLEAVVASTAGYSIFTFDADES